MDNKDDSLNKQGQRQFNQAVAKIRTRFNYYRNFMDAIREAQDRIDEFNSIELEYITNLVLEEKYQFLRNYLTNTKPK